MKPRMLHYASGIAAVAYLAALTPAPAASIESERRDPCALEVANEGGIGGTGAVANAGGIGGTGIVGTITGFASVCVNGIEVHYDNTTPVFINGIAADINQLAIGQLTAIEAMSADAGLAAHTISVLYAVVGPIERVDSGFGRLRVLGQNVQLHTRTQIYDAAGAVRAITDLKSGDWLRVSGLRSPGGVIMATRIERVAEQPVVSIVGNVTQLDAGGFWLNGMRIHVADRDPPRELANGRQVLVTGTRESGAIRATSVRVDPALGFPPTLRRLVIEGLVAERTSATSFILGGAVIALPANARFAGGSSAALQRDRRVIVHARVAENGDVVADTIIIPPDLSSMLGPATPSGLLPEFWDPMRRRTPVDVPGDLERRVPQSPARR